MLVYLVQSARGNKTYVGSTKKFSRRIRQHNGEIQGGAKYTRFAKDRPWHQVAYVTGFQTWNECLSFEWHAKYNYRKKQARRGIKHRVFAFHAVAEQFRLKYPDSEYLVWRPKKKNCKV